MFTKLWSILVYKLFEDSLVSSPPKFTGLKLNLLPSPPPFYSQFPSSISINGVTIKAWMTEI